MVYISNLSNLNDLNVIKYNNKINYESYKDYINNIYVHKISPLCTECTICLENFKYNDNVIKLGCYHVFHPNCIYKWICPNQILNTCPTCRQIIKI